MSLATAEPVIEKRSHAPGDDAPRRAEVDAPVAAGVRLPHVLVDARFKAQQRGGDRCRFELARNLCNNETDSAGYTFLAFDDTAQALRDRAPAARTVTTNLHPHEHPRGDWFEHFGLPKLSRGLGADIYHGTFNVVPWRRPAPLVVLTVHDMAVFAHPGAYSRKFAAYGRVVSRMGIRKADRIITVSDATARELIKYVPEGAGKIITIHNGVGEEFLRAAEFPPERVEQTIRRLNIPAPYVLFVGNLERKKNLPNLIEAFRRLRAGTCLKHSLVIVGEKLAKGPDVGLNATESELADAGVHFTGYIEDADLPVLYRGADLAAYPSIYEGFGMPVLEGMAAGVPVLTSNVSSLPEVAGGAAMLVDPYDVEDMAAGLHRALTDKDWRRQAVATGAERAAALSWAQNARRTARVYQELWEEAISKGRITERGKRS
ncbi:MAG: glycosyltransferase family 4 protein [Tepidisphaeraceae bacterium]